MASRKTRRSKSSPPKQHPNLRPRPSKNDAKNLQQNALKSTKNSRKRKRKCEVEDIVDGPRLDMFRKKKRLLDVPSSEECSSAVMMEGVESIDGGPLEFYPMNKKGRLYIIHNYAFNDRDLFREGSGHDIGKLTTCFDELGFVHDPVNDCKSNLTCEEMKDYCKLWAKQNHSDVDCIILAILTHGAHPDQLQGCNGKYIPLDELLSPFKRRNPTLVGKPKIFFIEACRGTDVIIGIKDPVATSATNNERKIGHGVFLSSTQSSDNAGSYTNSGLLPPNADHLIAFATGVGHPAYRNREKGSFYIEELTETLHEEHSKKHLVDIITKVQGRVSNLVKGKFEVQMPEFISRLRGPLYLS